MINIELIILKIIEQLIID